MNDDLDAIRRVLAADVESFRRLVERYQRPLLTLIRNLTPPDTDHEGVAQEVFLAAFRFLASFDPKRSVFSTWLFTIARNRCCNELSRRRPVVGGELPDVVNLRSPERAASEAELFHQLDAALGALPFEQRSAFVLAHLQGLSYEETNAGRRYRILFATDTGRKDAHRNSRKCTAAEIGRLLDAVSGPWFVMPSDGRVSEVAMHVLRPLSCGPRDMKAMISRWARRSWTERRAR